MRIDELLGVKKYQNMEVWEFERYMDRLGYIRINQDGTHVQGVYWKQGDPFVYRIDKNDAPYGEYVRFLLRSPPNPHYPKIYGRTTLPNFFKRPHTQRWGQWNITKVEYIPLPFSKDEFFEFDKAYNNPEIKNGIITSRYDPDGKWTSLLNAFYAILYATETTADVGASNFGKRTDGTVVILDPLWEGASPYQDFYRQQKAEQDDDDDQTHITGSWNRRREQKHQVRQTADDDIPF